MKIDFDWSWEWSLKKIVLLLILLLNIVVLCATFYKSDNRNSKSEQGDSVVSKMFPE